MRSRREERRRDLVTLEETRLVFFFTPPSSEDNRLISAVTAAEHAASFFSVDFIFVASKQEGHEFDIGFACSLRSFHFLLQSKSMHVLEGVKLRQLDLFLPVQSFTGPDRSCALI